MENETGGIGHPHDVRDERVQDYINRLLSGTGVCLERFANTRDRDYLGAAICWTSYLGILAHRGGIVPLDVLLDAASDMSAIWEEHKDDHDYDHNAAIDMYRRILELGCENSPLFAESLGSLAGHLFDKYNKYRERADIDEAVLLQRQAVDLSAADPELLPRALSNLATFLCARWEMDPDSNGLDIEDAIAASQKAMSAVPPDDPDRILIICKLAHLLEERYDHKHESSDLHRGIALAREALELDPPDPGVKAMVLNSLSDKLQTRYERSHLRRDLDEAIEHGEEALRLNPKGHPSRVVDLDSLGNKYSLRFEAFRKPEDLQASLSLIREGLEITEENCEGLNNLATALWTSYLSTHDVGDLQEFIETLRKALAAANTANTHSTCLKNLGFGLRLRFEKLGDIKDLEESAQLLLESWSYPGSTVFTRVEAAAVLLKILPSLKRLGEAADVAEHVVGLLPTVDSNSLSADDLQHFMSTFMDIASGTCAVLLECGLLESAICSLEKSRAVALGHEMDQRNSLRRLREDHESLGLQLERLLMQVNSASPGQVPDFHHSQAFQQRRSAYHELRECIDEIRALPGYGDFFASHTIADMRDNAEGGSIVFVNVAELRSDAIIVTTSAVKVVRLPQLLSDDATQWRDKTMTEARGIPAVRRRNELMLGYLSWLWSACVRDILADDLVRAQATGGYPPRVWWIGCGLAASMPFHAAGIHGDSSENAYQLSISSYIPSVKALAYARKQPSDACSHHDSILVATMETTPYEKPLREPINEKNALLRATRGVIPFRHIAQPSSLEVMEGLQDCTIAHFACHAGSHPVDPRSSCLIFQGLDESGTPQQDRLTVSAIRSLQLRKARIAFLSACQTSENKARELADEVTHLATAFQVAGFPHVIGCLWSVRDDASKEVAEGFYGTILQETNSLRLGGPRIALALRDSVMALRELEPESPLHWAPFIHLGP